jgi:hypothetical protein
LLPCQHILSLLFIFFRFCSERNPATFSSNIMSMYLRTNASSEGSDKVKTGASRRFQSQISLFLMCALPNSSHPPSEHWDAVAKDTLLLLLTHSCIFCLPPPPAAALAPPVPFQTYAAAVPPTAQKFNTQSRYALDATAVISRLQLPSFSDHVRVCMGEVAACIVDSLILYGKVSS